MQYVEVSVEFNGIVIYDPAVVTGYYNGGPAEGENLFQRYITTDEGDDVLRAGLIVPVLAIDDAGYEVLIRRRGEVHEYDQHVVHRNHGFALRVETRPLVTDLYSLRDWSAPASAEWHGLEIEPGYYRVDVDAFSKYEAGAGIVAAGYIFTFEAQAELPPVLADTGAYMRVFDQPVADTVPGEPRA